MALLTSFKQGRAGWWAWRALCIPGHYHLNLILDYHSKELNALCGAFNMNWIIRKAFEKWVDTHIVFGDSRIALCISHTCSLHPAQCSPHVSWYLSSTRSTHQDFHNTVFNFCLYAWQCPSECGKQWSMTVCCVCSVHHVRGGEGVGELGGMLQQLF